MRFSPIVAASEGIASISPFFFRAAGKSAPRDGTFAIISSERREASTTEALPKCNGATFKQSLAMQPMRKSATATTCIGLVCSARSGVRTC
ncbi:hypothetical protein RHECNPAF_280056 [Rhizobium etli CNPAF512]|nr:hypothetical protein RHECNPAF_280056 [Rhizobium etli CNPAF512]